VSIRSVVAISGLWVITVAAASALTWSVISVTGAQLGEPAVVALPTPTASASSGHNPATWTGDAGKFTARCTDESIALVAATPADGYIVEVKDRGPVQLQLEFERSGAAAESRVRATCINGSPVFTKL
jgi:hypothetical protein